MGNYDGPLNRGNAGLNFEQRSARSERKLSTRVGDTSIDDHSRVRPAACLPVGVTSENLDCLRSPLWNRRQSGSK
jgi:hypothetical protein